MPRSTEPTNVIQETKDYGKFHFLGGNREVNVAHVDKIKESIKENGNFLNSSPILVNGNFEIIDGQHRFLAAKELHETVFYTVAKNMGLNEARAMNILNKGWKPVDFARSYATQGVDTYRVYLKLVKDYPVGHRTLLIYINGGDARGLGKKFREGLFEIPNLAQTKVWLNHLTVVVNSSLSFKSDGAGGRALLQAQQAAEYNPAEMEKRVIKNPDYLKSFLDIASQIRQIEGLYNKGNHYRTRLF